MESNVPFVTGGYAIGNTAYNGGAYNKDIASYRPWMYSSDASILPNEFVLNARSDDIERNNGYITNVIRLYEDQIIGNNYHLRLKPKSDLIFPQRNQQFEQDFATEVQALWHQHASQTYLDCSGHNTFIQILRMSIHQWVMRGEFLASVEWLTDESRPFCTAINPISSERLDGFVMADVRDYDGMPGNVDQLRGGVGLDVFGKPLGYLVRNRNPYDFQIMTGTETPYPLTKWVNAKNAIGRSNFLHIYQQKTPGQTRGKGLLWSVIADLHMHYKYKNLALMSASIKAMYAWVITSDLPSEEIARALGSQPGEKRDFTELYTDFVAGWMENSRMVADVTVSGSKVPHLMPGSKMEMVTPPSDESLGSEFEKSLLRNIAGATGLSYEQLSKDYSNSNYSSSKASDGITRKSLDIVKQDLVDRVANEIMLLWLEEMINADRFPSLRAVAGDNIQAWLYGGRYPRERLEALANARWIGSGKIILDDVKDASAASMRVSTGLSTLSEELASRGIDFEDFVAQRQYEKRRLAEAGLEFASPVSVTMPVQGSVSDPDETGDE